MRRIAREPQTGYPTIAQVGSGVTSKPQNKIVKRAASEPPPGAERGLPNEAKRPKYLESTAPVVVVAKTDGVVAKKAEKKEPKKQTATTRETFRRHAFFGVNDLRFKLLPYLSGEDYGNVVSALRIDPFKEISSNIFSEHKMLLNPRLAKDLHVKSVRRGLTVSQQTRLIATLPSGDFKKSLLTAFLDETETKIPSGSTMTPKQEKEFTDALSQMRGILANWNKFSSCADAAYGEPLTRLIDKCEGHINQYPAGPQKDRLATKMSTLRDTLKHAVANGKINIGDTWSVVVSSILGNPTNIESATQEEKIAIIKGLLNWGLQTVEFVRDEEYTVNMVRFNAIVNPGDDMGDRLEHYETYGLESNYFIRDARSAMSPMFDIGRETDFTETDITTLLQSITTARKSLLEEAIDDGFPGLDSRTPIEIDLIQLTEILVRKMEFNEEVHTAILKLFPMPNPHLEKLTIEDINLVTAPATLARLPIFVREFALISALEFFGFDEISTSIAALIPHVPQMSDETRGSTLILACSAMSDGHCDANQIKPLMEALSPFTHKMPKPDREEALTYFNDAVIGGRCRHDQFPRITEFLIPGFSKMAVELSDEKFKALLQFP